MKALHKLALAGLLVALLAAACAPAATPEPEVVVKKETVVVKETSIVEVTAVPPPPKKRIALVPAGRIGTSGLFEMAGQGYLKAVAEFGLESSIWESEDPEDWERNVRMAAQLGFDLVIGIGSTMADAVAHVAPEFPDTHFALVDAYVGGDNTVGLIPDDHEASFVNGVLAALMTAETDLEGVNDAKVLGFLGGMDIPVIHNFHGGYTQGAKYIDPEIEIMLAYVGSFRDPPKAKELALAMYGDQDVDIIYSVTGSFGDQGVFEAAEENGLYVLCQDMDREAERPGTIMMCAMRQTDLIVYDAIVRELEGRFESGEVHYGVDGGYIANSPMADMGDKIPAHVREKLEQVKQDIADGKIVVTRTN